MRVAVVLGAAVWAGGRPSPPLARRAAHAAALWRAGRVDAVLGCGGIGAHGPAEAAVIARLCRAEGVPAQALHVEDRSTTTRQNLTLALPILRAMGATQVVIVTDPWHAPRARLIARQLGLRAVSDSPPWRATGPRQLARHTLREGVALMAVLLRLR
jgi:uncharacterized SAM-binding protein YcdF (DUF218 family)